MSVLERVAHGADAVGLLLVEHAEHAVAQLEDAEQGVRPLGDLRLRTRGAFAPGEDALDARPGLLVDQRLVESVVELPRAPALADVARVFEQRPDHPRRPRPAGLAEDAFAVEASGDAVAGLGADEAVEQDEDGLGVGVRDELVVHEVVAEGDASAHEHAEPERGADLVPHAVAQHLAFELGEAHEDVHHHASGGVRGVELLGDGDEGAVVGLEDGVELGEVGEGARQAVDLVDDHDVDPAVLDVPEHLLKGGTVGVAAGEAAVAVLLDEGPAVALLALDVGERGVPLRVERVVGLFEALFGRLAHVDGAAPDGRFLGHGGYAGVLSWERKRPHPLPVSVF